MVFIKLFIDYFDVGCFCSDYYIVMKEKNEL